MQDDQQSEWLVPTTGAKTLPVIEILTGRGFITGKSGSGKSNTASVVAEELLDNNYNLLVVDPEGEYYGLKERYEILHVGNDELCDVQVGPEHAEQLADIALEQNMPIILDVSDYLDADEASDLIANVVRELFKKEKDARKPFLLMIEEMQEYLPQQGGSDELGELLERVAKRGRKRGLGMLGMSQRPSSVDKDFITQCDWMVWHRLTWQNDIDVVRKVLGSDIANQVEDLDTGEGYLMTDWDESVERVQFKRKSTHDAGATPGLESYERPDLKSVSQDLVQEIKAGGLSTTPDTEAGSELADADRDALHDAVETVEAEGDAISEMDPVADAGGETSADGTAIGDDGTAADDPDGRTTAASLQSELDEGTDLASLSEAELQDRIDTLQRRNQILEDEVSELRSVLQNVERAADGATTDDDSAPTTAKPAVSRVASGSSGTGGGSARSGSGSGGRSRTRSAERPNPSRPVPPDPPVERDGVAGNMVEFVAMLSYLWRSLTYRCRLLWYRLRQNDGSGVS